MRTQLLTHNKTAYNKVVKAFDVSDRTCVVHPTGTGKSYLIAAVSESYKNVLILGPNIFVLDQVRNVLNWRKEGVEYMTYILLMYKEQVPTGYDLICLDEFHRAGAPEWGDAVDRLLEANPQAKVFGTTATPIRFLDDNRDMADELFEGNIASYMSLKDAWDRDILAMPRFVTGLFEFDTVTADMEERIKNSRRISPEEKKTRLTRINNLRLDWERSQGMPQIIRKHIDKDARRIIVFCGNVDKLKDMEQTIREWFHKAGIKIASVYTMHAYMPDKELKDAMDGFESNDGDGIKLMLSVNMLNEGVHIPRVNAVILLRTTSSKIIYLQQIGRCLTAEKKDKPIILDMVDNITTTNIVHDIKEGFDWYEHQNLKEEKETSREPRDFVVYDYTLGIRQAIEKLLPTDYKKESFEIRFERVKAFCEKYGRTPTRMDEHSVYLDYCDIRSYYADRPELIELRNKYGIKKNYEYRFERFQRFVDANKRLPVRKKEPEEYANYFVLYSCHKENPDERMAAIIAKYRKKKVYSAEEVLQMLIDFIKEHDRLPSANYHKAPIEEQNLRRYVREKLSDNPIAQELIDKYSKCKKISIEDRIAMFKAFVAANDRLPRTGTDHREYLNMGRVRKYNYQANDPELNAIFDKYRVAFTDEEVKQMILDFFGKHGRLPRKGRSNEEAALEKLFRDHQDPLYQDPEIIPILATRRKQRPFEETVQTMIDYTNKHGCRPSPTEEKLLYDMWQRVIAKRDKNKRCMELYNKYGGMPSNRMGEYIAPLVEFVRREHRLPSTTSTKEEHHLYSILVNIRKNHPEHPEVKPLLDEIASWPTAGDARRAKNDEEAKRKIIEFVEEHNRLPKYGDNAEESALAAQWTARRNRLCEDDPVMQAILDQYDRRPLKLEKRYAVVRDWVVKNGRMPRKTDGDIYQKAEVLRRTYRYVPEVHALLEKYGRKQKLRVDLDGRLDQIEAFANEHGRLPSTAHSSEVKLGRWWVNAKRNYGSYPRIVSLIERFPIQNRK